MIADLFSLSGIVPIEKRSKVEARKQGLHYGAYAERLDKPKSKLSKSKPRWNNNNPLSADLNSTHNRIFNKAKLSKEDKEMIKETDEEFKLRGHFKRIFPNGNYCLYKSFFMNEKPFNILVDNK